MTRQCDKELHKIIFSLSEQDDGENCKYQCAHLMLLLYIAGEWVTLSACKPQILNHFS